jgi:parallel beta-helix repeat protein
MLFKNHIMLWVTILAITIAPKVVLARYRDADVVQCYNENDASTKIKGKVKLEANMTCSCANNTVVIILPAGYSDYPLNPALVLDGGELDLNGFTVSCDETPVTVETTVILVVGKHGKVKNGIVGMTGNFVNDELANGIVLAGEGEHSVDAVTVLLLASSDVVTIDDAAWGTYGIWLVQGSKKNTLKDSSMLGVKYGIEIEGNKNMIDSCVVTNSKDGIVIFGEDNDVKHCSVVASSYIGFFIIESNRTSVTDSSVSSSSGFGGIILGGEGNVISKNKIFRSNFSGMLSVACDDFHIRDNVIISNGEVGIVVVDNSTNGEVSGNTVFSNGLEGIFVSSGSDNNIIYGNRAMGNSDFDLYDDDGNCDDNIWDDNIGIEVNVDCVLNNNGSPNKKGIKMLVQGRDNHRVSSHPLSALFEDDDVRQQRSAGGGH